MTKIDESTDFLKMLFVVLLASIITIFMPAPVPEANIKPVKTVALVSYFAFFSLWEGWSWNK